MLMDVCCRERVLNTSSLEASIQQLKPSTAYDITVVAVSQEGVSPQGAKITVETNAEGKIATTGLGCDFSFL